MTVQGRDRAGSASPAWLAAQLAGLLAVGGALGALAPGAGIRAGVAGGLLAFAAIAVSGRTARWWRRAGRSHVHWSQHGPDVVTREVVRTGVALLVVLLVAAPLALGSRLVPVWALAATAAGVLGALPAGTLIELRAVGSADGAVATRRLWRLTVGIAGAAALTLALLAALAGLVSLTRALAWTGTAVAALATIAALRVRWTRGSL